MDSMGDKQVKYTYKGRNRWWDVRGSIIHGIGFDVLNGGYNRIGTCRKKIKRAVCIPLYNASEFSMNFVVVVRFLAG